MVYYTYTHKIYKTYFLKKNLIFHNWFLDLFSVLFFNDDPRDLNLIVRSGHFFEYQFIYLFVLTFRVGKMIEHLNMAPYKASNLVTHKYYKYLVERCPKCLAPGKL